MHIGHLRGAIFGDVLAKLLTKTGFRVTKEYYVNDLGAQVDNLAATIEHHIKNKIKSQSIPLSDNMYKGALSFKTGDLDSYVNGSLNSNTTTFTMPTIDNLRIGGTTGPNYLGGHVARFMYYPVKLTNNQLATLTS